MMSCLRRLALKSVMAANKESVAKCAGAPMVRTKSSTPFITMLKPTHPVSWLLSTSRLLFRTSPTLLCSCSRSCMCVLPNDDKLDGSSFHLRAFTYCHGMAHVHRQLFRHIHTMCRSHLKSLPWVQHPPPRLRASCAQHSASSEKQPKHREQTCTTKIDHFLKKKKKTAQRREMGHLPPTHERFRTPMASTSMTSSRIPNCVSF